MTFPFQTNDSGQMLGMQAILGGVASANAGVPVLQVSTVNSITTTAISANQQLSAVLLAGTANIGYVSAFVDNGSVSAKSGDANQFHVSGFSPDASLFRVSAIGGTTGDRTLVDGTTQTISATLTPISAKPAGTVAGLVTNDFQSDASQFRVSAILAAGISGSGAQNLVVSAVIGDAGTARVSSLNQDANFMHISGFSPDAGLFRVSATLNAGVSSAGAQNFVVSAIVDNGSISARSGDANQVHTSAVQGDAGLFRASAFESVVTTNTGGASLFSTSGGIAQISTLKSTAGRLYGYHLGNPAGVDQYLQVFNASGGATLGTDVPTLTLPVPAGTGSNQGAGAIMSLGAGIGFSAGIQVAVTSTATGNTAGASAMRVNIFYA